MDLDALLDPYDQKIWAIVLRARALLLKHIPGTVETPDGNDLGYGYNRGYRGLLFVLSPHARHVTLGIYDGAKLPDLQGLMEGRGARHRHVKLRDESDLENPTLLELIRQAAQLKASSS
jgi:hypothetical protein